MVGVNSVIPNTSEYGAYVNGELCRKDSNKNKNSDKIVRNEMSVTPSEVKKSDYGQTIGEPKLSEKAKKYYDSLKKKYGNYDFILVSEEEKANARANSGKYGNSLKTVVLIDEDKIEKMANDENYRKKIEGIISGASAMMEQFRAQISGKSDVIGFGMQVKNDGSTDFFAVMKDAGTEQKNRIKKASEKKQAEKKVAEKKQISKKKDKAQKAEEKKKAEKTKKDENVRKLHSDSKNKILHAESLDGLLRKIDDFTFEKRSNIVQTAMEKKIGQSIDYKG